ncbi:MAG: hypothetical protein JU82_06495 [Sulfuricurvum sp. MLSB]|uniref:hypothetical protein n=1 Tax=unclassified Sulfuricurvum TaxID=2632390 RepID=UPI0005027BBD|nr:MULTISPECIES: hypothetical protein [unclassified Sulfuricurvum]KFN39609.1 MAG: hypothetical protein JU82_06495 [Sulfuricurvum sp. MLSB]
MRGEVKKWYQIKRQLEKEDFRSTITGWIEFFLKIGLAVGTVITWFFYFLYVGVMPSINNLGDITVFLIMIAGIGILISFIFIFFHISSSIALRDEPNFPDIREGSIHIYIVIPIVIHVFGWCYIIDMYNNTGNYLFFLCLIEVVLYLLYTYEKYSIELKKLISVKLLYYVIYFFGLLGWSLLAFWNVYKEQNIALYFTVSTIIFVITFINIAILTKVSHLPIKVLIVIAISLIFMISQVFSAQHIPNPIIVFPFSSLKLGYYKAELHFKEDFINKSMPFILNETNQTTNTFFILSSVGDEYILRETRTAMEYNESNISRHNSLYPFDYNGTRYYCEDNNQSLIWNIPDSNTNYIQKVKNRSQDFNKTVEKQLQHWKNIDQKTYRIKKENVDFEVLGKEIDIQSTVWMHNAKKKIN